MLFITWKPQTIEGLYFLRCSSSYAPSSKTKSSNNTTYLIERKGIVHNHGEEVIMEYYKERVVLRKFLQSWFAIPQTNTEKKSNTWANSSTWNYWHQAPDGGNNLAQPTNQWPPMWGPTHRLAGRRMPVTKCYRSIYITLEFRRCLRPEKWIYCGKKVNILQ